MVKKKMIERELDNNKILGFKKQMIILKQMSIAETWR